MSAACIGLICVLVVGEPFFPTLLHFLSYPTTSSLELLCYHSSWQNTNIVNVGIFSYHFLHVLILNSMWHFVSSVCTKVLSSIRTSLVQKVISVQLEHSQSLRILALLVPFTTQPWHLMSVIASHVPVGLTVNLMVWRYPLTCVHQVSMVPTTVSSIVKYHREYHWGMQSRYMKPPWCLTLWITTHLIL